MRFDANLSIGTGILLAMGMMAAVLILGADAVQVGTRSLLLKI